MTTQKISGNEYAYSIAILKEEKNYCFQILSQHKKSKRTSRITNLNFILSDIVSEIMNYEDVNDSWIDTNKKKAEKLFETATECFKNQKWIEQLEEALDEDRMCGEWEGNYLL